MRLFCYFVFFIAANLVFCFPPSKWEDIGCFFDLPKSSEGIGLGENIKKLIEKQLELPSGREMWSAFSYWHKKFEKRFSFTFAFEPVDTLGASILLEKYDKDGKKFCFTIRCPRLFFQKNLFGDFFEKNMLCRPCLVKLNDHYHLREQELPFFITLAHEFLHALNQLERIQYILSDEELGRYFLEEIQKTEGNINSGCSMQKFLEKKLKIPAGSFVLEKKYKELWQNGENDDSLDEMSVILGSERETGNGQKAFIGETSFLREFYKNGSIVSWSHNSAHDTRLWTEVMPILLEETYLEAVQQSFYSFEDVKKFTVPETIETKEQVILNLGYAGSKFEDFLGFLREEVLRLRGCYIIDINLDINSKPTGFEKESKYWKLTIFPWQQEEQKAVRFLPKYYTLKEYPIHKQANPNLSNYTIVDVPSDGNCAFTAVMAYGNEKFRKFETKLNKEQLTIVKELRKAVADEMQRAEVDRPDFIEMLRQPGFWNNGIDGSVGIEVLSFVARHMGRPILVLTLEPDGCYRYWVSGTVDSPWNGNLAFHAINEEGLGELLDRNPGATKLFHNGIHFQAIVEKEFFLPPLPPAPSYTVKTDISMIQEPAFSVIGTPPFSTENQRTIPFQLEMQLAAAGYRIENVSGDGNCAFHAYAFSAGVKDEPASLREAAFGSLKNFRMSTSESEDTRAVMDELAGRLRTNKEWVGIDDLKWLGQSQARDIIVIQPKPGSADHVLVHEPTAPAETPLEKELPTGQLCDYIKRHEDSVFLYYDGTNHFQAIVRNDSPAGSIFEGTPSQTKSSPAVLEKKYKDS